MKKLYLCDSTCNPVLLDFKGAIEKSMSLELEAVPFRDTQYWVLTDTLLGFIKRYRGNGITRLISEDLKIKFNLLGYIVNFETERGYVYSMSPQVIEEMNDEDFDILRAKHNSTWEALFRYPEFLDIVVKYEIIPVKYIEAIRGWWGNK